MSTSACMSLPPEIIQLIVDALTLEDAESVKALSLVCRALLPHCRKCIFTTISVSKDYPRKCTTNGLWELIKGTPELGPHIRRIVYLFGNEPLTDVWNPMVSQQLTQLRSLEIIQQFPDDSIEWSWNIAPHRHALLSLLRLPTLTHLQLSGVHGFPLSDLIPCVNLRHLEIRYVDFGEDELADLPMTLPVPIMIDQLFVRQADPCLQALSNAQRPDGRPIVDLTSLKTLCIWFWNKAKLQETVQVFQKMPQLVEVEIFLSMDVSRWDGLYDSLKGSLETLRCLKLDTPIRGDARDPMPGLSHELEKLRYQNSIKSIELTIEGRSASAAIDRADHWGTLDHTLSKAGWSALKYVFLGFKMMCMDIPADSLLNLRGTHFAGLASSSKINFEVKVLRLDKWKMC